MSAPAADVKTTLKAMKASLDAAAYAQVVAGAQALTPSALEAASLDAKQRSLVYTMHAFVGLAHFNLQQPDQAEASYLKATALQDDQFPAYKGLYDLYTQQGAGASSKLRPCLEKLVATAPPGLKKLAYISQLARIQVNDQSTPLAESALTALQASLTAVLGDRALAVRAESKTPEKDAFEVARITLEVHTTLVLVAEALERWQKEDELRIRLNRQLNKYRTEKVQLDKVKAQQAASKAGQIAAAVATAKGGPAPLTQAEEEAEITRKVTLKLEKDLLEKESISAELTRALAVPSPIKDGLDPNHQLLHEHALARLISHAHVQGAWTTSAETFAQALEQIQSAASNLFTLSAAAPSAYACRILVGLRWSIGGVIGQDEAARATALQRQTFFEQAIAAMTVNADESAHVWMAWHALASSMASTETASTIALPPAVAEVVAQLPSPPTVFELAECVLKTVATPSTDSTTSSSSSCFTPSLPAATPLVPSHLSLLALSYALQKQGESKHKECLATLQTGLNALKAYKSAFPFDGRAARATIHLELTLAAAYSTKVLDERILDSGVRIYQRILKTTREAPQPDAYDLEAQIRALNGLAQCALLFKPADYVQADSYVQELAELTPNDDWVWGMRGLLKYQSALASRLARQGNWQVLFEEAGRFAVQARTLKPTSPQHALLVGQIYWELEATRTDPKLAREAFVSAEALATAALISLPAASATAGSLRALLAESLGLQGLWYRDVAHQSDPAKKLFARALKVDLSNEVAGEALCDLLLQATSSDETQRSLDARVAAVRSLAMTAVSANPRSLWGWRRLGRCQFASRTFDAAIVSFQNALRIDGTSVAACGVWEELANSYNAEGQYVAAFKAMSKCVDLGATHIAANDQERRDRQMNLFQLAQCQLNLAAMPEAIATLSQVVDATDAEGRPCVPFIPAIKLLGESLFVLANSHVQTGAYDAAAASLERALVVARRCNDALAASGITGDRQSVSLWKLIGDCYALYNSLPTDAIPSAAAATESTWAQMADLPLRETNKLAALQLSQRAYAKAMYLDPTMPENWYDAALSQLNSALALHAPTPQADAAASPDDLDATPLHPVEALYRERALSMLKGALLIAPQNTCYWHLLAIIDVRPLVRQHAFSQAVTLDPKDAMGWTALGCFYLQQYHALAHQQPTASTAQVDDRQVVLGLSRHALEISQTLDPANPSLWMAQGLFNQGVASLEAYVQSKACFIRSLELYPSQLARFGLAYTAYCTGDIATAAFAIRKFTQQYPLHATAWNLAGLIWEHSAVEAEQATRDTGVTHAREAVDAFARAEELLLQDTQFDPVRKLDLLRMVRVNRARAAVTAGMFTDAIALYQALIQHAAAQAQAGTVPPAAVFASALTLHVDLTGAYTKAGSLDDARNVLATAIAISEQQIASVVQVDPSDPSAGALHQQRGELISARRGLLLQQAQLYAMSQQYGESKQLLQQSVSEHADHPHPLHYFQCMAALYALGLKEGDMPTATYAVDMMSQCIAGLVGSEHSEEVMASLQRTFFRIQAHMAVLANDATRAARLHAKIIHLDPSRMESWNEFYSFLLQQQASSPASLGTIFSTCTLPTLDFVHVNRIPQASFYQRLEVLALAFLPAGRTGFNGGAVVADKSNDEADSASLWKDQEGADDDAEFKDDGADTDVRAKGTSALPMIALSEVDVWPRVANLNSSRLAAQLLHMDPTSTNSWGIQAISIYSQAVQAAASASSATSSAPLFTKAIKLLQLHTTLLTAELTAPQTSNPSLAASTGRAATVDLFNCQVLLVDSYLRRGDANDVEQASLLLNSIADQKKVHGDAFPLDTSLVWVLFARVALRSGDVATALKHYRSALESKPLAVELWEELAQVYLNQGAAEAAEACLQAALTLLKAEAPSAVILSLLNRIYLRLSHHAYAQKQFDRGVEYAQMANRDGTASPTGFYLAGISHAAVGHPDQAMRAFQQALNLRLSSSDSAYTAPLFAAYHAYPLGGLKFSLALLFTRSASGASSSDSKANGALAEARDYLLEEVAGGVATATIYYQLALTSSKLLDTAAASSYIRTALQLRPSTPAYERLQLQINRAGADAAPAPSTEDVPDSWDE